MSLLHVATLDSSQGEVKEIFKEIVKVLGALPEGIQLWSINPEALKMQWNSIKKVFTQDKDTQKMHTIIRYLVSEKNLCEYCIGLNGGMLVNMFGIDKNQLEELSNDLSIANLNDKNRQLLQLAIRSVDAPMDIDENFIQELRDNGISDKEMFDVVHAASQMLVVNTLFNTFKV